MSIGPMPLPSVSTSLTVIKCNYHRIPQLEVITEDLLHCASKGEPTANVPMPSGKPIAFAPPVVATYNASFQSMDNGFCPFGCPFDLIILSPSLILETTTACLIACIISTLYPPAMSVPSPTFTPMSNASLSRNGSAEK